LRYKDKNGLEDLEKAKIYLNWLIDELVAEDLNKTFDERFEEIEREEQEKCSCGCVIAKIAKVMTVVKATKALAYN
jgi:hypothetical protein